MRFLVETYPAPNVPAHVTERITQVCGVNEYNEPLMRLEWGGHTKKFLAGHWRAKYRKPGTRPETRLAFWVEHNSLTGKQTYLPASEHQPQPKPGCLILPELEKVEFCDPFWYLAEWVPPEKSGDTPESWERKRYRQNQSGQRLDVLGEFPHRGRYVPVLRFAGVNDEFVAADDGRVLQLSEALWALRKECAPKGHWRDFMSQAEVDQISRDVWDGIQAEQDEKFAQFKEEVRSAVAPHAHSILKNPRVFIHRPEQVINN